MSFQNFVDAVGVPCCILSVEETPEGKCGRICICEANQAYREAMGPGYYEGMPYGELVPADNKFEDYCFRAAIRGQRMHAYVEVRAMGCWIDQVMIPLARRDKNTGYCQYIFESTKIPESYRMACLPAEITASVVRSCIMLMGKDDFRESVGNVIAYALEVARAEVGRIMLIDHDEKKAVV